MRQKPIGWSSVRQWKEPGLQWEWPSHSNYKPDHTCTSQVGWLGEGFNLWTKGKSMFCVHVIRWTQFYVCACTQICLCIYICIIYTYTYIYVLYMQVYPCAYAYVYRYMYMVCIYARCSSNWTKYFRLFMAQTEVNFQLCYLEGF